MKNAILTTTIILSLFFTFSCNSGSETKQILLTEQDNGRIVSVNVGDSLRIELGGNPTTGYEWDIVEHDATLLTQIGTFIFEPASNAIGASGTFVFLFDVIGSGETTLRIEYHRSFETNPPEVFFEIIVRVSE